MSIVIADYYPATDVDSCWSIGMSGKCGLDCSVYLDGNCEVHHEMIDKIKTADQLLDHEEIYGKLNLDILVTLNLEE